MSSQYLVAVVYTLIRNLIFNFLSFFLHLNFPLHLNCISRKNFKILCIEKYLIVNETNVNNVCMG